MELFVTFIFIFIGNMRIIHTNIRKLYDVYENRKYNKYTNGAGTATLPEHLSSSPVFSGVRFTRYIVLCDCFVDRCLYFCTFSFDHCVVCSSSIYGF